MSQGFREVAADDAGGIIPLANLAGPYSTTAQGSQFICFKGTPPFSPARCGSVGSVGFPFSFLQVGAVTRDAAGNACATATRTFAHLSVDAPPPRVLDVHIVSQVTSYDPATGTGDDSTTSYSGGACNGPIFDSTGARVTATSTFHFTASREGKRLDFVITSLTTPVGSIGGFSVSGTELRQ